MNITGWICPQCQMSLAPWMTYCCKKKDQEKNPSKNNNEILNLEVRRLFTVKTGSCLNAENIFTVGELINTTESELSAITNFGKKSLNEVLHFLRDNDLCLKRH